MAPKKKRKADSSMQEEISTSTPESELTQQFIASLSDIYKNKKYDFDMDVKPIFSGVKHSKVVEQQLFAKVLELQVCVRLSMAGFDVSNCRRSDIQTFVNAM
jgi:hypothetical protein